MIGQFGSTYVIAEGPDGMYMIDQHAAHERVLYERFCRQRLERRPDAQALLEPVTLELSPPQRALLAEQAEPLREHGFQVEPFGEGVIPGAGAAGRPGRRRRPAAGGGLRSWT